jgi:hypothetical protein
MNAQISREMKIAHYLSEEGFRFNCELRDTYKHFFENLRNSYFSIASALGFCWSGYADNNDEFIQYTTNYLDGKIKRNSEISKKYCFRFGADKLEDALMNYKIYYEHIKHLNFNFKQISLNKLNQLQQILLTRLDALKRGGTVRGIGPWLFLGPFKILLCHQDRLWNNKIIDSIVLPTGSEVDRGIKRLKEEKYTFLDDFDIKYLREGAGSIIDGYGTCAIIHKKMIEIGSFTNTPALHINSALHLYGRKDI